MWKRNVGPNRKLESLGKLAIRLARIAAYQQLMRGETQLRAGGLDVSLREAYKAKAIKTIRVSKRRTRKPNVVFVNKGDF